MGPGARAGLRERMGHGELRPAPRVQRRRRGAAQGRAPRRPLRQGVFRLHGPFVLPAAPRGRPRGLPPVREPCFAGKMNLPPDDEGTGLPGVRSWGTVYWIVIGVFAAWVALLTALTRAFS